MNIAAITVLFNPDKNVISNIYTYLPFVSKLYIIDNSEIPTEFVKNEFKENSKVNITTFYENKGIAFALNVGVTKANESGFSYILTMDQDSFFSEDYFLSFLKSFEKRNALDPIAVAGPCYENGFFHEEFSEVNYLITSGSILHIPTWSAVGKFNENLFIDHVDTDYCFRVKLSGKKVIRFNNIKLEHRLGEINFIRHYKTISLHSYKRMFFITRNTLYIINKYKKQFPQEAQKFQKDLLVRIKNNLIFGKTKFKSAISIVKGTIHYFFNNWK